MRSLLLGGLAAITFWAPYADGQNTAGDDVVSVFTEHPRLFLRPARLRLLQKERERASARWQQFDAYLSADAPLPEPGFAEALYYQVSGSVPAGRKAIAWALGPEAPGAGRDLRQLALVFDWCQKLLTETERRGLAARILQGLEEAPPSESIPAMRARVLAAVALYDDVPDLPNRELQRAVRNWWEGKMAPSIARGQAPAREDAYALWEIFHAIRDNTNLDLRESAPRFFKSFPVEHLMSNYPATYPGEDNDFHIDASTQTGLPNLTRATFSRAGELAMVAFDTNAEESQYLQGWLMHDRFELRSSLGAPYEFLWANQYQPGLSFTLLPLVYHNPDTGTVFVRSDWDESAQWFGYFDGAAQIFRDGRVEPVKLAGAPPLLLPSAVIYFGASRFRVKLDEDQSAVIVVGLAPGKTYQVEVDDEEVLEQAADPGGVLVLDVPHGKETGVRLQVVP
ncbi:MAG TPA: hypothetical protein VH640_31240 [Bryobacteraceae bacterium]|jgi:hypothetical protein